MLQEADHVGMSNMIEEAFDVGLYHPLGALQRHDLRDPAQRIVCAAARTKAVGAIQELRFPNGLQDQAQPVLDQAVLKAGHSERTVASTPLGDVGPPRGIGPIAHAPQAPGQIVDPIIQTHRIVCLRYPIHSGRLPPVLTLEAGVEPFRVEHPSGQ